METACFRPSGEKMQRSRLTGTKGCRLPCVPALSRMRLSYGVRENFCEAIAVPPETRMAGSFAAR